MAHREDAATRVEKLPWDLRAPVDVGIVRRIL